MKDSDRRRRVLLTTYRFLNEKVKWVLFLKNPLKERRPFSYRDLCYVEICCV